MNKNKFCATWIRYAAEKFCEILSELFSNMRRYVTTQIPLILELFLIVVRVKKVRNEMCLLLIGSYRAKCLVCLVTAHLKGVEVV